MGKSGIIAQKISATLASTGTPSLFLHPAEAIHGDLGRIVKGDVLLALSNSGDTEEILALVPWLKRLGAPIVALTGNPRSPLAQAADVHLDVSIRTEACPLGLAPTASTTAALAMGDALSMALLERRGFTVEDFAVLHPGGRLGKKLLRVEDAMHTGDEVPRVPPETPMKEVLFEMTRKRLGLTTVAEADGTLLGRHLRRRPAPPDGAPRLRAARPHRRRVHDREPVHGRPPRARDQGARRDGARKITSLLVVDRERPDRGRAAPARPLEDGDDLAGGRGPMKDEALAARCRALKLILTDVDGVMTDGTVLLLPDGGEAKAFHIRDGLGVVMAQRAGLRTGVAQRPLVRGRSRRAAELGDGRRPPGRRRQGQVLREILAAAGAAARGGRLHGRRRERPAGAAEAGLSAAPADAALEVRLQAFMVTEARGGQGCLREFVEAILRARGEWDEASPPHGSACRVSRQGAIR